MICAWHGSEQSPCPFCEELKRQLEAVNARYTAFNAPTTADSQPYSVVREVAKGIGCFLLLGMVYWLWMAL